MKKAIFHVDQIERLALALNNIIHVLEIEPTMEIELLAHGNAVQGFLVEGNTNLSTIEALSHQGVTFALCHHSLDKFQLSQEQLSTAVTVVPAGAYELIKKQTEGFIYIKP
ncbi:TPA: DsrE family protein [Photobacterium damselae]